VKGLKGLGSKGYERRFQGFERAFGVTSPARSASSCSSPRCRGGGGRGAPPYRVVAAAAAAKDMSCTRPVGRAPTQAAFVRCTTGGADGCYLFKAVHPKKRQKLFDAKRFPLERQHKALGSGKRHGRRILTRTERDVRTGTTTHVAKAKGACGSLLYSQGLRDSFIRWERFGFSRPL